jgi:hypothetical protein
MILCPIARAVGCKKCPIFTLCPVKGVIGDYKKEDSAPANAVATPAPPAKRASSAAAAAKRSGGKRKNRARRGK